MANFLEYLRQQNIFGPRPPMIGNDLPSQGGITGRMSLPPGPNTMMDINAAADPTAFMPPPQFNASTDYLTNLAQQPTFGSTDITQPPTPGMDISQYTKPLPNPDEMDAGARMRELYQPSTDAQRRLDEFINQYPQEQNPSWLRRIGAMLVDYSKGPVRGEQFFHEPYNEAVQAWKNRLQPIEKAADLERYENVNQRTLAYNQMATELRERALEAKEKNDERNAQIKQQRADIYAFKAIHPDWKIQAPKGGNIVLINPQTGETQDTGIPTGTLTEIDKIHLTQENALDRIAATGEEQRVTEGVRQQGRMEAIGARGEQARQTKAIPPGGVTGKPESATQTKVREYNAARQIVNSSPALARFIKLGQSNEFTIIKPNERGGPTPQQYSDIINAIYKATSGGPGRSSMAGPGPTTSKAPPAPAGWKYVPKPGGGWTAVRDTGVQ